jgi:hypothetical protein
MAWPIRYLFDSRESTTISLQACSWTVDQIEISGEWNAISLFVNIDPSSGLSIRGLRRRSGLDPAVPLHEEGSGSSGFLV